MFFYFGDGYWGLLGYDQRCSGLTPGVRRPYFCKLFKWPFKFCFGFWATLSGAWAYSWFCIQESLLVGFSGPHVILGIEPCVIRQEPYLLYYHFNLKMFLSFVLDPLQDYFPGQILFYIHVHNMKLKNVLCYICFYIFILSVPFKQ